MFKESKRTFGMRRDHAASASEGLYFLFYNRHREIHDVSYYEGF